MSLIQTSDRAFRKDVLESPVPVLVDFYADWCGPCRMVAPVLEELGRELGDRAVFAKLNVDHNPAISSEYGIMSIPTLALFKNGQIVRKTVGVQSKAHLMSMICEYM